ncbi:hypothetical protein L593_13325 [Salinarchaeum sp. Harcht-Bsk1]|nr:hypothetical protein L593_13325 [Salinarchaeum sp. Harcht-Bsk1]
MGERCAAGEPADGCREVTTNTNPVDVPNEFARPVSVPERAAEAAAGEDGDGQERCVGGANEQSSTQVPDRR